ncbi:MAG: hypothetical protein AAGC55_01805, partial [Myxococcota bacterium]
SKSSKSSKGKDKDKNTTEARPKPKKSGLTFKEKRELDGLEDRIAAAEAEVAELEAAMGTPRFFDLDHTQQAQFLDELSAKKTAAETMVERWAELEEKRGQTQ